MTTYRNIAAKTLREFAEANGMYVPTETAEAAIEAIVDALVEAGETPSVIGDFLDTTVVSPWPTYLDEPNPSLKEEPSENADLLKQAAALLLKVAESL